MPSILAAINPERFAARAALRNRRARVSALCWDAYLIDKILLERVQLMRLSGLVRGAAGDDGEFAAELEYFADACAPCRNRDGITRPHFVALAVVHGNRDAPLDQDEGFVVVEGGLAEFGKNRTLRFSGHP
ncbi:hypothetical protein [Pseudomonas aeruginosa]|uniref:hypothetical protein n=1 Tax=Pseudomonas aeruginosa TaxID=287 RepID=UPI003C6DDA5A